jgi:hypothetical protein
VCFGWWHPSWSTRYKPGDNSWMIKGSGSAYDKWNISVFSYGTYIMYRLTKSLWPPVKLSMWWLTLGQETLYNSIACMTHQNMNQYFINMTLILNYKFRIITSWCKKRQPYLSNIVFLRSVNIHWFFPSSVKNFSYCF